MIEFTQTLSDRDYKKAIITHYFSYGYTYIGPVFGLVILIGLALLAIFLPKGYPEPPLLLYLLAAYMLFRPLYYVYNIYKSIKSNKLSSNETSIKITGDNKIIISNSGNLTSLNISDFHSFYDTKNFLFLYLSKNHYQVLDKRQIKEGTIGKLRNIFDVMGIKKR